MTDIAQGMNTDEWSCDEVIGMLKRLGIGFESVCHEPIATMEEGEAVAERLGVEACKNLFLVNRQGEHFLLLMKGNKMLRTKDLARQIGSSHLSFAPAEDMTTTIGAEVGAASVLGLMFDAEHKVQLLADKDILSMEWLGCHPCVNTCSLKLRIKDVLGIFLPAIGHTYYAITV